MAAAADAAVLTVGFATAVARGLLAAAAERFRTDNPGWRLQLRQVPWSDPSAGLADATADVAVLWLPLADPRRLAWTELASEPRHVALPRDHPLAGRAEVAFADLLGEPFLALPDSAGALRDFWLAVDARGGRPPVVGGVVTTGEETFEAVAGGAGVALLSAGNAEIYRHSGVVTRPVTGLAPSRLAVAWRRDDDRPVTASFVRACTGAARSDGVPVAR
ncbi:LysR family substrate-binding domain-containing protein [Geodermatophilus sp. DSM 44513]|uniref:LysR family substrate-binding domain-containing protein n=1 Tax=Geodermatophilus sp. DSM 44513 TaxID=1528104 RepID=UPI0012781DBF|nr:LysR family substrate-binding domain-containing protein [Geodermatophilus sp. DSM 44513]WNV73737.1 LysR family substrate-binding domain-containing protein [Geodermatophilus sp. DSM 44513]